MSINRCAVTVRAKQPFLDWLEGLPDMLDMTLEEVNEDPSVYLLPEVDDLADQEDLLAGFYDLIFEEELVGWWTEEDDWPQVRTLGLFMEWFEVEFHSMIVDLVEDEPLVDG